MGVAHNSVSRIQLAVVRPPTATTLYYNQQSVATLKCKHYCYMKPMKPCSWTQIASYFTVKVTQPQSPVPTQLSVAYCIVRNIRGRKLLRIATKLQNSQKFSLVIFLLCSIASDMVGWEWYRNEATSNKVCIEVQMLLLQI